MEVARWQTILRSARDAVICIDAAGRMNVFNPAAEAMFGYCADEVLGQSVSLLMTLPERDEHEGYLREYHRTGVPKAIGRIRQLQARRKNGEVFPIELSVSEARAGDEVVYTAIIRDVTDRKKIDEAIASRVNRQAAIAELGLRALRGARLPDLMNDAAALVVETLNVEFCKILELLPDGKALRLRAGVGWREGLVGHYTVSAGPESQAGYTLTTQEPVILDDLRTEHRFNGPQLLYDHAIVSGMSVIIHGRGSPYGVLAAHTVRQRQFTTEDTHFLQAMANVLATTIERAQAEKEVREFQALAQQRERLADLGAIAAQVVHDLGNPVAALSLQAELLLRRASRDPSVAGDSVSRPAARIAAEVRRLDKLINDFKDFARQQRLERTTLELPAFLHAICELWRPVAAQRHIELELTIADHVPTIRADEGKLRRLLDNLIKNAVEAFEAGPGQIRIQVSVPTGDKLRISVCDSGSGIRPGAQVFRLFETTKPGGMGLGLSVAKQIALAHGGNLEVERLEPHGSAFHLDLPLKLSRTLG